MTIDNIQLPEEYVQLDYIENKNSAYINTEFILNQDSIIEILCTTKRNNLFGARASATSKNYTLMDDHIDFDSYSKNRISYSSNTLYKIYVSKNGARFYNYNTGIESTKDIVYNNDFTCDTPAYLFSISGNPYGNTCSKCKVYYLKIWDNDTLERDFVPCISPNNEIGMYDLVYGKFYGSEDNNYSFTAGNRLTKIIDCKIGEKNAMLPQGYKKAKFIQSSGAQYIDTGIVPTINTELVVDFQFVTDIKQQRVAGIFVAGKYQYSALYENGSGGLSYGIIGATNKWTQIFTSTETYKRHTMRYNTNGQIKLDNTSKNLDIENDTIIGLTLPLFGERTSNTKMEDLATMKLYSCQIYEKGILVRNFIPCINGEEIYGLYDSVEGKFYKSLGTSEFSGREEPEARIIKVYKGNKTVWDKYNFEFDGEYEQDGTPTESTKYPVRQTKFINLLKTDSENRLRYSSGTMMPKATDANVTFIENLSDDTFKDYFTAKFVGYDRNRFYFSNTGHTVGETYTFCGYMKAEEDVVMYIGLNDSNNHLEFNVTTEWQFFSGTFVANNSYVVTVKPTVASKKINVDFADLREYVGEQTIIPIDLQGNEICAVFYGNKNGIVTDKLLIDKFGNVSLRKNINKYFSDNESDWKINNATGSYKRGLMINSLDNAPVRIDTDVNIYGSISDTFPLSTNGSTYSANKYCYIIASCSIYFSNSNKITSTDDLTVFLQSHLPMTFYYQVDVPYTINLGTIQLPAESLEHFEIITNIRA